jgi:hypothetical protein
LYFIIKCNISLSKTSSARWFRILDSLVRKNEFEVDV